MNEQQTVWVVSEDHDGNGISIIGVYTDKSVAQEIYKQSKYYSIDEVVLNAAPYAGVRYYHNP